MLQISNPKNTRKKKPREIVSNSATVRSGLKMVDFKIETKEVSALVDTGSTDCLLSVKVYESLKKTFFTPLKLNMKVAGHVLKENVIGCAVLPIQFKTGSGNDIVILQEFLIAHALNGYSAILGSDFLMNESILRAITPSALLLTADYNSESIPLRIEKGAPVKLNFIKVKNNEKITPMQSENIEVEICSEKGLLRKRENFKNTENRMIDVEKIDNEIKFTMQLRDNISRFRN
jgi:hypothetical protein